MSLDKLSLWHINPMCQGYIDTDAGVIYVNGLSYAEPTKVAVPRGARIPANKIVARHYAHKHGLKLAKMYRAIRRAGTYRETDVLNNYRHKR
jgi:hypothetical protein